MPPVEYLPLTPDLSAVQRGATLTDQAYARLRTHILTGTFLPGERISIRKLAEKMQISFTPAREALLRLAVEGAVTITAMRNVSVARLRLEEVEELYLIREHLEGLATSRAVASISIARLAKLDELQATMSDALDRGDYKSALQCNYSIHFGIYRESNLHEVLRLIEGVWLRIGPSLHLLYPTYQISRRGLQHHSEALDALRAKDARAARNAIVADIRDGRDEILRALRSANSKTKIAI